MLDSGMELFTDWELSLGTRSPELRLFDDNMSVADTDKYLMLDQEGVFKKIKKIPSQRDYKKNICRNILRQAIKSMNRGPQLEFLESIGCTMDFIVSYQGKVKELSGFRNLKQHLLQEGTHQFKQYLRWFLRSRCSLFILNGESNNVREHLRYKNEVMLFYTELPTLWCSNEPVWKYNSN